MTGTPSEGAAPQPWVLDVSALTAMARGDEGAMTLIQSLDARRLPLVIPVLAAAGASLAARDGDADDLLAGLENFPSVTVAAVLNPGQALALATVISRTGLDPWDAHVAAVADESVCPIVTLDAAKWREHASDLDEPLHFIEIEDPEE